MQIDAGFELCVYLQLLRSCFMLYKGDQVIQSVSILETIIASDPVLGLIIRSIDRSERRVYSLDCYLLRHVSSDTPQQQS